MITFGAFLSIISITHMWLMGNKWKYAPLWGVVMQGFWFYYATQVIHDYGLLLGVAGYTTVNIRNAIKWMKEDKK